MTRPPHLTTACREVLPYAPGEGRPCGREAREVVAGVAVCPTHAASRRALEAVARVAPGVRGRCAL